MTSIIARCKPSSDNNFYGGNREDIDKGLVDVTSEYYWTGTGSIISRAPNQSLSSFGIGKDDAVTFNSHNSLTTFQWDTTKCKKIKITNNGRDTYTPNVSVKMKSWSSPGYDAYNKELWEEKCDSLPCTVTNDAANYYILKVKSSAGAIDNDLLRTICVD